MPSPMSPMLVWHSPSKFHACRFLGWYFTACTKRKHKQLAESQQLTTCTLLLLLLQGTISPRQCHCASPLRADCGHHNISIMQDAKSKSVPICHGVFLVSRDTYNSSFADLHKQVSYVSTQAKHTMSLLPLAQSVGVVHE